MVECPVRRGGLGALTATTVRRPLTIRRQISNSLPLCRSMAPETHCSGLTPSKPLKALPFAQLQQRPITEMLFSILSPCGIVAALQGSGARNS
jgi:hypothetical protein